MRLKKRWRIVVSVLVPVLLVIGVPAWFLLPPREMAVPSDAVVVLAGASDGRHQLGAQLVEEGTAENFVVSNPRGAGDRVGSAHCRGQDRPEGAAEEGWSELTVVTNRPHNRRVRTMFEHCTDLEVTVVSSQWVNKVRVPYHVAREVAGYMKFWITDPCGD